jgi:cystathionine beta-lyase/cystathionine gamma-synthase
MRLETQLIHAGEPRPRIAGAVAMPLFQSSTFEHAGDTGYHDVRYIRLNNTPNHLVLHAKLAALEHAEAALVTSSGMSAISTAILAIVESGDHILVGENLYGGTHDFIAHDLPRMGVTHDVIDVDDPSSWEKKLRPRTRLVYVETMTNPLLIVGDLARIPAFARAHGLVSMIDNTFASPVNFRPIERGFDLSLHSCTKYLNGHTDLVAGAVCGSTKLIQQIKHKLDHLGGSLDPHACWLLHRGMKTLALRVRHQNESALRLANFLATHTAVARVHYAGLPTDPRHARARELLSGFGGVLSFELNDNSAAAADRMITRLELPASAPSLGGVESLITRPATTSHKGLDPTERRRIGISDALVRVSIGLEATDDLIADFEHALS